ncbi:MAG TPA: 3-oxoacyl-ACP reductase, partial [Gammaproteobacteria bacterium]|nr:3-oxoacyl-ACP reductase [Gammaproteobacteria bacterium]
HPGVIQTSMGDHVMALGGGNVEQKWAARIAAIPLGEAGTVHDVASCVLFLASDEARHITGAELVVDGGMTIC